MHVVDRVCSEISMPSCRYISEEVCKNSSRNYKIASLTIMSPTTLTILIIAMASTRRMMGHVKALCSSIGRKEMLTFFYLYFGATAIEAFLVGFGYSASEKAHLFLTTLQVSLYTSAFFVLFLGCITIDMFMGVFGIRVATLLRGTTAIYSVGMGTVVFVSLSASNKQLASIPLIVLNMLFFSLYILLQLKKLKKRNGEVWAFGTLLISLLCFTIANVFLFVGSAIIGIATNRYFDNLFFYHFFILCTFIMAHKYWLSVYDYEVESLRLEA
jgi:hypothetical protein